MLPVHTLTWTWTEKGNILRKFRNGGGLFSKSSWKSAIAVLTVCSPEKTPCIPLRPNKCFFLHLIDHQILASVATRSAVLSSRRSRDLSEKAFQHWCGWTKRARNTFCMHQHYFMTHVASKICDFGIHPYSPAQRSALSSLEMVLGLKILSLSWILHNERYWDC